VVVSIGISMAGPALAHPGHGSSAPAMGWSEGLRHVLSQPDHIAMLIGAVAAAVVVVRAWRAARARRGRRP
jgi:hydrogenase/urease accessory protein HupE